MSQIVADLGLPGLSFFDELDLLESPIKDNCNSKTDKPTLNINCNFFNVGLYDPFLGNPLDQGELVLELGDLDNGQSEFNKVLNSSFDYPLENLPCSENLQCQSISSTSDLNFSKKFNPKISTSLPSSLCPSETQYLSVSDFPYHNLEELSSLTGVFPLEISRCDDEDISDADDNKLRALHFTSNDNRPSNNRWSDSGFNDISLSSISTDKHVQNDACICLDGDKNLNCGIKIQTSHQDNLHSSDLKDSLLYLKTHKKVYEHSDQILKTGKIEAYKSNLSSSAKSNTLLPFKIVVKTKETNTPHNPRRENPEMVAPFIIPQASCSIIKIPESEKTLPSEQNFFDSVKSITVKLLNSEKHSCPRSKPIASILSGSSDIAENSMGTNDDLKLELIDQSYHSRIPISPKLNKVLKKNICRLRQKPLNEPITTKNLPFRSLKRNKANCQSLQKLRNKVKAYELAPLNDPQMEKCRKNAINAKKNRDLKKVKMLHLQEEIAQERLENEILIGENESLRLDKVQLESQINNIIGLLEDPTKLALLIRKIRNCDSADKLKVLCSIYQANENAIASDIRSS